MRKTLLLATLLAVISAPLSGNQKYFKSVQQAAKAYRVDASLDNMKVVPDEKGKDSFYLALASNRNNFEMVMLVGYIAAGQAMKTGFAPESVFVTVDVPLGEGFRLVTTASSDDVKQLLAGKINTAQFVRKVKYL